MQSEIPNYIGAIGGLIGAVGGIVGTWISIVSLKRTNQHKAMDLRLQLQRDEQTIRVDLQTLPNLLHDAKRSRHAVLSARGGFHSGARQKLDAQHAHDTAHVTMLDGMTTDLCGDISKLSLKELESRALRIHGTKRQIDDLRDRYKASLAEDDREREHIRAAIAQQRTNPPGKP